MTKALYRPHLVTLREKVEIRKMMAAGCTLKACKERFHREGWKIREICREGK